MKKIIGYQVVEVQPGAPDKLIKLLNDDWELYGAVEDVGSSQGEEMTSKGVCGRPPLFLTIRWYNLLMKQAFHHQPSNFMQKLIPVPRSLRDELNRLSSSLGYDILPDTLHETPISEYIDKALDAQNARIQKMMKLWLSGLTFEDIGKELKTTREFPREHVRFTLISLRHRMHGYEIRRPDLFPEERVLVEAAIKRLAGTKP